MIDDVLDSYVRSATAEGDPEDWDLEHLWTAFSQIFPVSFTADQLIEELAPSSVGRIVIHLLDGDGFAFTTAYLHARHGLSARSAG